jgi:Kef-type K+ transport system membrane component KefB
MKKFGFPRVIGQIAAGLLLGIPFIESQLFDAESLNLFILMANVGIVLLFFFIGLQLDLRSFSRNLKEGIFVSLFNTSLCFVLGVAFAFFIGLDLTVGLVFGIALAVSSQTVTFDLMDEFGLLKSRIGTIIVASGAIDDLIEFILISVILAFLFAGSATIETILLNLLAFIGIITIFKIFVVPWILEVLGKEKSPRGLFMAALLITALMAFLGDYLGVSSLIGAFVAGAIVRRVLLTGNHPKPWEEHSIAKSLDTVSFGFFVPLFFVSVGLNTDLSSLANIQLGVMLAALAIFGTVLGSTLGVLMSGRSLKEGILIGFGVSPKGDVDLVISTLALGSGLISLQIFSSLVVMALTVTIIAPVIFRHLARKWIPAMKLEPRQNGRKPSK